MKKKEKIKESIYDLIWELLFYETEDINILNRKEEEQRKYIKGVISYLKSVRFSYNELENVDLENSNLDINLRKISTKELEHVEYGDAFIKINKSNFKGNNIYGDLSPLNNKIYFWYSEDTFDEAYKSKYNKFFLDDNAPDCLKDKYYNPKMKLVISKGKQHIVFEKSCLTFDEYIDNYEFLKGKYLGNFKISEEDKEKIKSIDKLVSKNKCLILKRERK